MITPEIPGNLTKLYHIFFGSLIAPSSLWVILCLGSLHIIKPKQYIILSFLQFFWFVAYNKFILVMSLFQK